MESSRTEPTIEELATRLTDQERIDFETQRWHRARRRKWRGL